MLDVCLLGTGGMMPLPYRWLTSLLVRYNGSSLLIDCGEGTQIAIKEKGWSFKPIDVICFTHYHGDHISGPAPDYGKCRPHGTVDSDWTERTGAGSQLTSRYCAGTAISDKIHRNHTAGADI